LPGGGTWEGKTEPGIWVAVYEVTQAQYQEIMGANPSAYKASPNCPVESLTWDDAVKFCQALTGEDPKKPRNWHYGLPSKAQFDIFALVASGDWNKAGMIISSPTKREHPEPVGSTGKPNTYGLYDVIGNVSEWLDSKAVTGGGYVNSQPYTLLRTESNKDSSPAYGFRVVLLPGE